MSYTPPSGNALSVDLAGSNAYSPPAASALVVEFAGTEFSGQTSFVSSTGQVSVYAFPPSKTSHTVTPNHGVIGVIGYAPSYSISLTSQVSSPAALHVEAYAPTYASTKTTVVDTYGTVSLTTPQPVFFKGVTHTITDPGYVTLQMPAIDQSKVSMTTISSAGVVTLSTPSIKQKITHKVATSTISVVGNSVTQKQKIRKEVVGKYFTPNITLDDSAYIQVHAYTVTYKQKIRSGIQLQYLLTSRIASGVIGVYTGRVANAVSSPYRVFGRIDAALDSLYAVRNTTTVQKGIAAPYRFPILNAIDATYSLQTNARVSSVIAGRYALVQPISVRQAVGAAYYLTQNVRRVISVLSAYAMQANVPVRASILSPYAYQDHVRRAVDSVFSLTSEFAIDFTSCYNIESVRKARAYVSSIYSMPSYQVVAVSDTPYVSYLGERIAITEAEVASAEGESTWKSTVVLANISDYARFRKDAAFSLVIGGDSYEFIVDSKSLDRTKPANYGAKLLGISPIALYTAPRKQATSYLWDEYRMASDIAEELIPGISWEALDWGIPPYRLASDNADPLGMVKILAAAIGATVESDIDGSVKVRSLYPVSVPNYAAASPSHVLLESLDIITVRESYVSDDTFNRVVITDVSQSIADSLEWIPDYNGATTGIMRAFIYPWRSGVSLTHTGLPGVTIADPSLGMEQHEEIIEIFQGQGQTQYPIHHIDSVQYEASNVGAIVFDVDSRSFTVGGPAFNSVIRLVYWTRSYDYRVALPETRPTQFLLESTPL